MGTAKRIWEDTELRLRIEEDNNEQTFYLYGSKKKQSAKLRFKSDY